MGIAADNAESVPAIRAALLLENPLWVINIAMAAFFIVARGW